VNTPITASAAQPPGAATQQDPDSALPLYQGAPQSQAAIAAATAHLPVQIEGVSDLNNDPENTRALATGVRLSAQQLADITSKYLNGSAQNYLPSSLDPVPTQAAYTDVTLKGNEVNTVTITGLRVVKQCGPPLSGTLFFSPGQAEDNTIRVGFDLDSSVSYAQVVSDGSIGGGDFFAQHVVTLAPGEVQTFELYLKTDQHDCRFTFQMSVATPTGTILEKIDDNGKPYELTGMLNTSAYQDLYLGGSANADGTSGWVQSDPKTYH
jgi:hypothetical protein